MRRMMQKYRLSRLAEKDLAGIWRYTLENWSREQAKSYAYFPENHYLCKVKTD